MGRLGFQNTQAKVTFWWGLLAFLTFYIQYFRVYLPDEKKLFGDTKGILACSGFKNTGFPWVCEDYLYGRFLRESLDQITFLHFHTNLVVFLILAVSLLAIAHLFTEFMSSKLTILTFSLFLSPSIALLIQRANLDILVFFLCWFGVKLYFRGKITLGLCLVLLASSFKIYPFALYLLLVSLVLIKNFSPKIKISWIALTVVSFYSTLIDIQNVPWLPSDARNSFGLRIFGEYLTYLHSGEGYQMFPLFGIALGIGILMLMISFFTMKRFKNSFPEISPSLENLIWFSYFFAIFVSGISIDYRLIFLLPSIALMVHLNRVNQIIISILFCLTYYLSYPFEILQVVGDLALFLLLSFYCVLLYRNREQIIITIRSWRLGNI